MKKHTSFKVFLSALASLTFFAKAYAVCPVCTVAVAGGVFLAEKYGIDNTITGVWVGGLTVSLIMWTINWMESRKYTFKGMDSVVSLAYFIMIPVPLFMKDYIGDPAKTLWGMDKLLLGMIVGSVLFYAAAAWYEILKKNHNNKAYFPFQRVAMPVSSLLIASLFFYLITKG